MRHTDTIRLSQTTAAAARHAAASGSTRLTGFHEIHADTVDAASLISGGSPASILSSLRPGARTFGTYIAEIPFPPQVSKAFQPKKPQNRRSFPILMAEKYPQWVFSLRICH